MKETIFFIVIGLGLASALALRFSYRSYPSDVTKLSAKNRKIRSASWLALISSGAFALIHWIKYLTTI